MTIMADCQ